MGGNVASHVVELTIERITMKAKRKPIAAAVTTIVAPMLEKRAVKISDAMMGKRDVRTVLQAETEAVSCTVRDDLIAARRACGDNATKFRDDTVALYGTDKLQEQSGMVKVSGRIVELFVSAGYSKDVEKTLRSDTKIIAAWFTASWETAETMLHNVKGRKVSHSDLAKLARKALGRTAESGNGGRPTTTTEPAAPTTTTAENIEQIVARIGVQTVLAACAKILCADKKTELYGKTVRDVVEFAFKVA